jgi:hypothetical protein
MRPVPEYDAKAWLLKAMRETAHAMESLIWELDDDALDRRPEPDEWSCKELVGHMCGMERRYTDWLERIVRMDDPALVPFDGESVESATPLDETLTYDLMDDFGVQRQQTVYLLWSLDRDDWERRGRHPYLGEMSITRIAREMNEHDLAHLWQLRRLCDRFEAASV